MRYLETFDKEEVLKEAKAELIMQSIPLTDENIEEKTKDLYKEWLAWKLQDTLHKDDGVMEFSSFCRILKRVSSEYCVIVEQWLYKKPLHYQGKYFTFEEFYNAKKKNIPEFGIIYELTRLIDCIYYFELYEKDMDNYENLTQKNVKEFKDAIRYSMGRVFFED